MSKVYNTHAKYLTTTNRPDTIEDHEYQQVEVIKKS